MKRVLIFAVITLLLVSTMHSTEGEPSLKVLVDESRVFTLDRFLQMFLVDDPEFLALFDWGYSFENFLEPWGFGFAKFEIDYFASVDIRKKGELSYSVLRDYDVLVLASYKEGYSSAEIDAIKKFVENGGGLLLFGDFEYPSNNVARAFDVSFCSEIVAIADDSAEQFSSDNHAILVDDITDHPITEGIDDIGLFFGIPISTYKSGTVLAKTSRNSWADREGRDIGTKESTEDRGPFDILLATDNLGKGRGVFFGGAISFWNMVTVFSDTQNSELFGNMVKWLGEPGGPYKQYTSIVEDAEQKMDEGKSLYNKHAFSEAKIVFGNAIEDFERSNEVYESTQASWGIERAQGYIEKCETGLEADKIFEKAEALYTAREYKNAIEEYETARPLYEEIGYGEQVERCDTRVEESKDWITLREEAAGLLEEAEEALAAAPSIISTARYEKAASLFAEARTRWEEYDDPEKVAACEEKIDLCNEAVSRITLYRTIMVVTAIAAVVVVVVVVIRRRRLTHAKSVTGVDTPPEKGPVEEAPGKAPGKPDTLDVLQTRYVTGEITKEEYEKEKSKLK
jgi:uncharacterized membrane protein